MISLYIVSVRHLYIALFGEEAQRCDFFHK